MAGLPEEPGQARSNRSWKAPMAEVEGTRRPVIVDFDGLKAHLLAHHDALPKRLKQVARFALEQPDDVAFGTVAGIAEQVGVQPSTIVRFAQALGFPGFSPLQELFRAHVKTAWPDYRDRVAALVDTGGQPVSGPMSLFDGFAQSSTRSVERLRADLSAETLERAVAVLAAAGTIYLVGVRRAFPVVAYLAYAFGKLGVRAAMVDHVAQLGPEQIAAAGPGDAVIAVSFAPYANATVELARTAVAAGVPVVAITDTAFSPLAAGATVRLEVVEADFAAFRSLAATFALAMTLAVAVAERRAA